MKRKPIGPRTEPLPTFSNYAQEVAFLKGHGLTTALKENDWESGPPPRRRGPVARRIDEAAIRRPIADAARAVRRYRTRAGEPRATSSLIGKVTMPVDVTTPRRAKNELRVQWILELMLFKGVVTCVHMVMTAGPFGKLGMIRGGAHDFFIPSLDEQIAGIEREGGRARDRATVRITLTTGHLGFRCGYATIRQSHVVPRRTYDALVRLFRRARQQLHDVVMENITRDIRPPPPGVQAILREGEDTPILSGGPRPRRRRAGGRKASR